MVSCMKPVIFLLYNNLFIYQVLCTLIYRRRCLYSFLIYETTYIIATIFQRNIDITCITDAEIDIHVCIYIYIYIYIYI